MKSKILIGVLAGFAAGALVGVLTAPRKGTNTRKKYAKKGEEAIDSLKSKYDDLLDRMNDKLDNIKNEVSGKTGSGAQAVKNANLEALKK